MKRTVLFVIFLLSVSAALEAQSQRLVKGTVVRMRMTDCVAQRGFMSNMSGVSVVAGVNCPEFTILSDKVVYVVVGRKAEEFMPLAENMDFVIRKNELVTFSDDEKNRSRFTIQQMTLRSEWEREEARKELATKMMERSVTYELHSPPHTSLVAAGSR